MSDKTMRILVTGSRKWTDRDTIWDALDINIAHTQQQWSYVLDAINYPGTPEEVVQRLTDVEPWLDGYCWRRKGVHLHFDAAEWDAFVAGARNGDFDLEALRG